ncbi:DUF1292 domain-containing protein [Butyrivibrio proteoclasticus]|uniref:DUF1292 domain-containing protein n=1 Tax=Butyrivibrio proteoclasticus TaxID=43305 RepID=UPI00047BEA59|nr:DUF1292 domain-containing protein [Butyrivibrio proteoclasticus]
MEFSKNAIDMNTKIENGEQTTVDIDLGDGKIVTCAIMVVLTVKDKDYIVLLPLDENGQNDDGNVWIYEFIMKDKNSDPELGNITDDDEYMAVSEAFDQYLDDVEFDEFVELPQEGLDGEVEGE